MQVVTINCEFSLPCIIKGNGAIAVCTDVWFESWKMTLMTIITSVHACACVGRKCHREDL